MDWEEFEINMNRLVAKPRVIVQVNESYIGHIVVRLQIPDFTDRIFSFAVSNNILASQPSFILGRLLDSIPDRIINCNNTTGIYTEHEYNEYRLDRIVDQCVEVYPELFLRQVFILNRMGIENTLSSYTLEFTSCSDDSPLWLIELQGDKDDNTKDKNSSDYGDFRGR